MPPRKRNDPIKRKSTTEFITMKAKKAKKNLITYTKNSSYSDIVTKIRRINISYDTRPWTNKNTYYQIREEYIFNQLQENIIWNHVSGGEYHIYRCFDENCKAKLRVRDYEGPVRIDVETKGEHIKNHNIERLEQIKKKKLSWGNR